MILFSSWLYFKENKNNFKEHFLLIVRILYRYEFIWSLRRSRAIGTLLLPLCGKGNWDTERLSSLPMVTQLEWEKFRVRVRVPIVVTVLTF